MTDLCVSAWVPVRVVDDDSIGPGQVHSYATHSCGQKKDKDGRVLQERPRTSWAQLRALPNTGPPTGSAGHQHTQTSCPRVLCEASSHLRAAT